MATTLVRRRCPHCGARPTWQYLEDDLSRWIGFCRPCGWIGRGRAAGDASAPHGTPITLVSELGGPDDAPVPNPWAGVYRLATLASPWVAWEPTDAPCPACGRAAIARGRRDNPRQRYAFDLCVECGEVVVSRVLTANPGLVRRDAGNVGTQPTSMGVRWLVRGLGL